MAEIEELTINTNGPKSTEELRPLPALRASRLRKNPFEVRVTAGLI